MKLKEQEIFIGDLDARQILDDMEKMEQGGAHFQNKQKDDVRVQYIAPVGITTFFLISIGLTVFALIWGYRLPTEETPPIAVAIIILFLLACVGVGIVTALMQRIREINRGEVDDAKKY